MPEFPPLFPVVILIEILFGIGYDQLVKWWHFHKLQHVSISVVIGVAVTLMIPTPLLLNEKMAFWKFILLLFGCFTASGTPMIIGSMRGTVRESHKRRGWPTAAMRARDDVIMELSTMAHEIAERVKQGTLTVQDLPDYMNRLHGMIGTLKSV